MRKIPLPEKTYARLEQAAKLSESTPDKLASEIILKNALRNTCHGCGLEAEDCPKRHIPAIAYPCSQCIRNPKFKDMWDERWTIDADNKPFIER